MIVSLSRLDKVGRDTVSGLVIGYKADAFAGVPKESQIDRLLRWRQQGWDVMMYYYNILAMMLGYQKADARGVQIRLEGF